MLLRLLFSSICLLVAGCATPPPIAKGDEAARAAQARYRALQEAQRPRPVSGDYELISVTRPESSEDGIIRKSYSDTLRIPRTK
jgi:hypothetical protein